jgi:hypothetical protein
MIRNTAQARTHPVFTEKDYLEFERFASDKHEFLDGSVYATAGESPIRSANFMN